MYQVKGYITVDNKRHHVCVICENAVSISDAEKIANENEIVDCTSAALSPIVEVFPLTDGDPWHIAVIGEDVLVDEAKEKYKRVTKQMLIQAASIDEAHEIANAKLQEGYNMALVSIKKSNIYDVLNGQ